MNNEVPLCELKKSVVFMIAVQDAVTAFRGRIYVEPTQVGAQRASGVH